MPNTFSQIVTIVGSETLGNVQGINAGKSDDGTPIYYELETQELEFSDRSHYKVISDQLTVVSQDGMNSQLQVKEDDGDYKDILINTENLASISKNIDVKGHFFTFKWFGNANESTPILEEILIDNIDDKGITNG